MPAGHSGASKMPTTASPRRATKRPRAENDSDAKSGQLSAASVKRKENAGDENGCGMRRSGRERSSVERYVPPAVVNGKRVNARLRHPPRFHITPMNEWEWLLRKMNCCVSRSHSICWAGGSTPPACASTDSARRIGHGRDMRWRGEECWSPGHRIFMFM